MEPYRPHIAPAARAVRAGQGGGSRKGHSLKIVQMLSHAGDMYVLSDTGGVYQRRVDPNDHNQGQRDWQPRSLWRKVSGLPDEEPAPAVAKGGKRDFGGPQE